MRGVLAVSPDRPAGSSPRHPSATGIASLGSSTRSSFAGAEGPGVVSTRTVLQQAPRRAAGAQTLVAKSPEQPKPDRYRHLRGFSPLRTRASLALLRTTREKQFLVLHSQGSRAHTTEVTRDFRARVSLPVPPLMQRPELEAFAYE